MAGNQCIVRVRLPRSLFRRLAAKAIEERTDLNSVIIRAVRSDLPTPGGDLVRVSLAQAKLPRS